MEYGRYLMEVVGVLESDPDFRAKLKNADNSDIRVSRNYGIPFEMNPKKMIKFSSICKYFFFARAGK